MPRIHHFKSLSSTQDKAKEFAKKGKSDIVVISDVQTKGRGRFKRKWHSAKGGLWMSILVKPKNTGNLQYLTFAAAVSVVKSIKKVCNLKTKIKWPNDVHYRGMKLCGILTEGIFGKENYAIVGIGLNINQGEFPDEIKNIATSLNMIKKKTFDKQNLAELISKEFLNLYNNYYNKNNFKYILKAWKKNCDTINRNVTATTRTKKFSGNVAGVDDNCNLLLKLKSGELIKIVEGDIKIRY